MNDLHKTVHGQGMYYRGKVKKSHRFSNEFFPEKVPVLDFIAKNHGLIPRFSVDTCDCSSVWMIYHAVFCLLAIIQFWDVNASYSQCERVSPEREGRPSTWKIQTFTIFTSKHRIQIAAPARTQNTYNCDNINTLETTTRILRSHILASTDSLEIPHRNV